MSNRTQMILTIINVLACIVMVAIVLLGECN